MIIDASLVFSDDQDLTVTGPSTNYVDTLAAGDSYEGAWLVLRVGDDFVAGGAATMTADLQTDDNAAFTSPTVLCTLGVTIPVASLIPGYVSKVRIPPGAQRYLRGNFTVATGPMTAGSVDLFICKDVDLPYHKNLV